MSLRYELVRCDPRGYVCAGCRLLAFFSRSTCALYAMLASNKETPIVKKLALIFFASMLLALALTRPAATQSVSDKKVYSAHACQLEFPDYTPGAVPAGWIPPEAYATGETLRPPYLVGLGGITGPNATLLTQWNVEVLRFWCPVVRDATAVGGVPTITVRAVDSSSTADVRCAAWATPPAGGVVPSAPWVSTGTPSAGGPKTLALVLSAIPDGASITLACEMRQTGGDMSQLQLLNYAVTERGID